MIQSGRDLRRFLPEKKPPPGGGGFSIRISDGMQTRSEKRRDSDSFRRIQRFLVADFRFFAANSRFLAATQRFLAASQRFLPATQRFLPAVARFLPASHRFLPAASRFLAAPPRKFFRKSAGNKFAVPPISIINMQFHRFR